MITGFYWKPFSWHTAHLVFLFTLWAHQYRKINATTAHLFLGSNQYFNLETDRIRWKIGEAHYSHVNKKKKKELQNQKKKKVIICIPSYRAGAESEKGEISHYINLQLSEQKDKVEKRFLFFSLCIFWITSNWNRMITGNTIIRYLRYMKTTD